MLTPGLFRDAMAEYNVFVLPLPVGPVRISHYGLNRLRRGEISGISEGTDSGSCREGHRLRVAS